MAGDLLDPASAGGASSASRAPAAPGRQPGSARRRQSRWLDLQSGLLFNEALPRTHRIQRDLRREATAGQALDLGPCQLLRAGAAADDRALWAWIVQTGQQLEAEFSRLQQQLGGKGRLYLRGRATGPRSYLFVGRRGVRTVNVNTALLRAGGIRSLAMPLKRFGRGELAFQEKFDDIRALADAIRDSWTGLQSLERRLARGRHPLIFPPLVSRRLAALRKHDARVEEIVGEYCPTPHIQFEGWRIRMLAYADALRTSVMTLNRLYNTHRRRRSKRYGQPRRVRFGLIGKLADSSWCLPLLQWRLITRARDGGNVIARSRVTGLTRTRQGTWRLTGTTAPVARPDGRLNAGAVALAHQPEMYPLLQPFDAMVAYYNSTVMTVIAKARTVIGPRPTEHPYGATPRAQWSRSVKVRWWA